MEPGFTKVTFGMVSVLQMLSYRERDFEGSKKGGEKVIIMEGKDFEV